MPAASAPACASLSSGRNMRWRQNRSVRPLSRPPTSPTPATQRAVPSCLSIYTGIEPIGAAAKLPDIGGQRGEAAVEVLSLRIIRDLLAACLALLFFQRVALLSQQTPRPRSACARNRSLHVIPAAAHRSDACKRVAQERETTVPRHQILSALLQNRRVPHAAYGTRPIGTVISP
ncbi:hypothetical protein B0H14DRAFT_1307240 [Mycena olivaceomarginata]|nr:hypothetical protein B0H14DRAFT_1307240 [Mycena olivaceomarginata]